MKTQTAVEWIQSIIQEMIENGADLGEDCPALLVHIKQAKEKEKEQIIDAHCDGQSIKDTAGVTDAKQYYFQTYGGDNDN